MAGREHTVVERAIQWLRASRVGQWTWYQHTLVVYSLRLAALDGAPVDPRIATDSWEHLECYRAGRGLLNRADFLAMARQRLAAGEHMYSVREGDQLVAWAWMVPNQRTSWLPSVRQAVEYPAHTCVLYGAYTSPMARGRGFNGVLTHARLTDAVQRYGARFAFTAIARGNVAATRAKRGMEVTPWLELDCRVRFGRQQLTRRFLSGDAPVELRAAIGSPARPGTPTDPHP